jgi:hypothetical protein
MQIRTLFAIVILGPLFAIGALGTEIPVQSSQSTKPQAEPGSESKPVELLDSRRDQQDGSSSIAIGHTHAPNLQSFVGSEAAELAAKPDNRLVTLDVRFRP